MQNVDLSVFHEKLGEPESQGFDTGADYENCQKSCLEEVSIPASSRIIFALLMSLCSAENLL